MHTPFYELQKALGASFRIYDEFQYELPAYFNSAESEYAAMNASCVCIDFSYYGHIQLSGKHALDFLNRMSTNDLKKLDNHRCTSTVLTNEKGRIIDLIRVYRLDDVILLTVSPQYDKKVSSWLDKYIIMDDVRMEIQSYKTIQIGLMGPRSSEILNLITKTKPPGENQLTRFDLGGFSIMAAPAHQLEKGFLLIADVSAREAIWNWIQSNRIQFCGMEAYLSARIEQKKPLPCKELSDKYNPLEAGLLDAVSFNKGCYIGQEVIARLDSYNKVQRHLVKIITTESIPDDSKIFLGNKEIGIVTSSSYSRHLKKNIALAYVKTEFIDSAEPMHINLSDRTVKAEFYP